MRLRPTVMQCSGPLWTASVRSRRLAFAVMGGLVSVGFGASAAEAPVYRCSNSYSSQPCPGGAALDLTDPRSAAQQREAREASERDAALARQLKAQRLVDERALPKGVAANLGPVAVHPPAKVASKPHQSAHKETKKAAKPAKPASAPR